MGNTEHFFGRIDELRQLEQLLKDRIGKAAVIVAPQGMGKSALVDRFSALLSKGTPDSEATAVVLKFCPARDDDSRFFMELMLRELEAAIHSNAGFFSTSPRSKVQIQALVNLLPKGKEVSDLISSLSGRQDAHPRRVLIDFLHELSEKLPSTHRALLIIDADKKLHPQSMDAWRAIVEELPERVLVIFTQRPDDVLATSSELQALPNVYRVPEGTLGELRQDGIEEAIQWAADTTSYDRGEIEEALSQYHGHPYFLTAAIGLLQHGSSMDDLPHDPTNHEIAKHQWQHAIDRPDGDSVVLLLTSLAVLEVPSSLAAISNLSGLDHAKLQSLLANHYLRTLINSDGDYFGLYHSILTEHVIRTLPSAEHKRLHSEAARFYLNQIDRSEEMEEVADIFACSRAFLHVQKGEGLEAGADTFADKCAPHLRSAGMLDSVEAISIGFLNELYTDSPQVPPILCSLGMALERKGKFHEAIDCHSSALELDVAFGNRKGVAIHMKNLGSCFRSIGEHSRALEHLQSSLSICELEGDVSQIAHCHVQIGIAHKEHGELPEAVANFKRALTLFEGFGTRDSAYAYTEIAHIEAENGNIEEARKMHLEARESFRAAGDAANAAVCDTALGVLSSKLGRPREAIEHLQGALEFAESGGSLLQAAMAYRSLGIITLEIEDYPAALCYFRGALEQNICLRRLGFTAASLDGIRLALLGLGHRELAEAVYLKVRELKLLDKKLDSPTPALIEEIRALVSSV